MGECHQARVLTYDDVRQRTATFGAGLQRLVVGVSSIQGSAVWKGASSGYGSAVA